MSAVLTTGALQIILAFIFGTAIGSFLNVLIWRLPREESIQGRSHCPHCHRQLVWHDLVPVLSFLLQRGKCKYCKQPISFRYPLIEVIVGALFALVIFLFPVTNLASGLMFAKLAVAVAICITVFVIDFEHELILDKVVFPGIVVMAVLFIALDILAGGFINIRMGLLGAAAGFIPFWLLWYASKWFTGKTGKWMGFGDVKFAAFMGLALGLKNLVVALFLSFTVGAVVGIVLMATGKKHFSSRIPFGTFLALATILSLFWGNQLWAWYWKLLTLN